MAGCPFNVLSAGNADCPGLRGWCCEEQSAAILGTMVCKACGNVQYARSYLDPEVYKFQCSACDEMEAEMVGTWFAVPIGELELWVDLKQEALLQMQVRLGPKAD